MNDVIPRFFQRRLTFGSRFIWFVALILSLHSVWALADSTDVYESEYERTDIPTSAIKQGQKLGTLYTKAQTLTLWRIADSPNAESVDIISYFPASNGSAPGCTTPGDDGSVGILRFNGTTTEKYCNVYVSTFYLVRGLTAYPTHKGAYKNGRTYYGFTLNLPRTKIADVVINNPAKALSHAGQAIQLNMVPMLLPRFNNGYQSVYIHPLNQLKVFIGETPPKVFFPQQNTYHAEMPLKIIPTGDLATGSAKIDMCLYDGAGLYTSHYMLMFSDESSTGISSDFTMYREGGAGKISYSVSVTDPSGKPQPVRNREPFYWNNMQNGGAAQGKVVYVQLPGGIQDTVPCVPSVVSIKVLPVRYASLMAGHYRGKINILFTPST